jgi:SAM-dependent methyltransferase
MKNADLWRESIVSGNVSNLQPTRKVGAHSWLAMRRLLDWHQKNLARYLGGRLLDLGCGDVPYYGSFKQYVTEWYCVDWPNSPHKNLHTDLNWDLARPLPIEDSTFDTVLLLESLEHQIDPAATLAEAARLLKPGGHLIVTIPFMYFLHEEPFDFVRLTRHALRIYAQNARLTVVSLEERGGLLEVLADTSSKALVSGGTLGRISARVLQRIVYGFSRTPIGNRISCSTGKAIPLGYVMICKK